MSLHQGNLQAARLARVQNSGNWAMEAVATMQAKVAEIAVKNEELHSLLEDFSERGGFDEVTDDEGNPYTDVAAFLSDGLGVHPNMHAFLIDQ